MAMAPEQLFDLLSEAHARAVFDGATDAADSIENVIDALDEEGASFVAAVLSEHRKEL